MKINVVFYSLFGHIYDMAEAVAEGAREVEGAEVGLYQVQETFTPEILEKMGATESKKRFEHLPIATPEILAEADAVIFGTAARFGMMAAQMRTFLDRTGGIWAEGALIGKAGSVFTSTSTQHGGQESTILNFHTTLLHHGMVIVGVPYSEKRQTTLDELTGGSPYGASTIAGSGPDTRHPTENELAIARFQGRHVAEIAKKLVGK
ncbi:NAD(P)H:quinone oxidoreductase [Methanolobus sp. ZRKC3]|uniref:NAD(P)H:quinone oxidoreductase n=1 Tax=Methanolobus sp. ZRKC3 TaxID=3125786 RepID=UPI0032540485